jgi:hypothetical protein
MTTSTDRTQYREMLGSLAQKTQARLPELNGRVARALKMALVGDVVLHPDGSATVASASEPTRQYAIIDSVCTCRDYERAPRHLCCHRLAAGFVRKAGELAQPVQGDNCHLETPLLPEARASVNVRVTIGGRECQLTLRDHDEARLLARLAKVLEGYPLAERPAGQAPASQGKDWCSTHQVAMKENHKGGRTWYSHQVDGQWCKGRG